MSDKPGCEQSDTPDPVDEVGELLDRLIWLLQDDLTREHALQKYQSCVQDLKEWLTP